MRAVVMGVVVVVAGYLAGACLGALAITFLSSNTHDRSVEAAMTAAFVTGPAAAVAALILWLVVRNRSSQGR